MHKDPGWFVNRSPTITLNDQTVQAGEIPGPAEFRTFLTGVHAGSGVIRIDRLTGTQTTVSSGGMFAGPLAITAAR